ncbi:hypothetical protein DMB38_20170 [Streptomyces sp. WAC 06738]|uniref:hypothetical protein n=1 Tax=Streptomyces sp. WAC 06738 TaxID=2203210 RepID=UPI000F6CFF90|nr:hypothetical protein [Streptomyces sp. WAC 06738]AZM47794.1 hypothetical protein DMB38_20170 [Streptomyces sp. WAC 06738]
MTVPIPLTLDGTSPSTGEFNPALRLITLVSMTAGRSTGNGTIAITYSNVPGAFTDFAVVAYGPSVYSDPAFSHPTSATIRLGGTDPTNTWKRLSVTVQARNSYYSPGPIGAIYGVYDYARLGVTSSAMALNETQQIAYVQFEKTPPGIDTDTSQFGSNLFSIEQSSYEGRTMYTPVGGGGETAYMTFTRTNEYTSCGEFSGKFVYQSPPATNSYQAVAQFGTYPNLMAKRQTYADVKYRTFTAGEGTPDNPNGGGVPLGTPIAAPAVLTLAPLQTALVRVEPGVTYQAQVSVAAEAAGQTLQCAVLRYDANFNLIGTFVAGSSVTTAGGFKWQQAAATLTMDSTAAWAAVVPRVTSGGASSVHFYVDEHRIWVPSTLATKSAGASPARAWQAPRQLIIKLRATRVNYAKNPSFQNSLWGWSQEKDASLSSTLTLVTGGGIIGNAAQFSMTTAPTATLVNGTSPRTGVISQVTQPALVDSLKPDTVYTASVYVLPTACPVPITLFAGDGTNIIRGTSSPIFDPTGNTTWSRLSVTFKTSSTYGGSLRLYLGYAADDVATVFSAVPPDSNDAVWTLLPQLPTAEPTWSQSIPYTAGAVVQYAGSVWQSLVTNGPYANVGPLTFRYDQLLVEQADKLGDYFDGNQPSADYMWEGTPGDTRSHYYRGKRVSQYRLDQLIQRQIGVGASYRLVYASAP